MVQHHVQHHAVGRRLGCLQGVGQLQVNIAQALADAALASQFEHGRAVVQGGDAGKASRQFRQEGAVTGADLQRRGAGWKTQRVEQGQQAVAVLRQAGDQVLLGLEVDRHARKEFAAGLGALAVDGGDARLQLVRQGQGIDLL